MDGDEQIQAAGGKKENRQAFLLSYLDEHHYISIDEITRFFPVTTQTARRDVMALEQQGKVRRLHGGAASLGSALPVDPSTRRQRRSENAVQKNRIGAMVAELVPDGATVFIDTGTTCEAVAYALLKRQDLRVITYSLRVATILSENSDFDIAVPGGFVRSVDGGVFQDDTPDYVRRFKFDFAIISVSGVDDDGDICDDDQAEVAIVSAALGQSKRKVLAVDSSKFGRRALVRLGSLSDIDILVTDMRPSEQLLARIRDGKIEVRY